MRSCVNVRNVKLLMFPTWNLSNSFDVDPPWGTPKPPILLIELGKLFYSVAKSSGKVEKEELRKLHQMVHDELVPAESDTEEFGTDSAYYAEIEFDILVTNDADPRAAFDSPSQGLVGTHDSAKDEPVHRREWIDEPRKA